MPNAHTFRRDRRLVSGLALLLIALVLASLTIGPAQLTPWRAVRALVSDDGVASVIVRDIRLPRTLLAILIGSMLGLSGAALQGLLRNPLADPAVFGAPQAAGFGAVLALYFGFAGALSWALPIAAICGALLSIVLVTAVAGREAPIVALVLSGLAVGALASAATSLAISLSPNPYAVTEIVFWLLGSLEDRSFAHVMLAAPFILTAMAMLFACGPGLRALTLGEEAALSLGIEVGRLRLAIVTASAIGVGASVAVVGAIGFIGLVAPHIIRPFVQYDPARTPLPSALVGALLLTAADCLVRLAPTGVEIRIGVVTAFLGVPFFLWIVARRRADLAEAAA